ENDLLVFLDSAHRRLIAAERLGQRQPRFRPLPARLWERHGLYLALRVQLVDDLVGVVVARMLDFEDIGVFGRLRLREPGPREKSFRMSRRFSRIASAGMTLLLRHVILPICLEQTRSAAARSRKGRKQHVGMSGA